MPVLVPVDAAVVLVAVSVVVVSAGAGAILRGACQFPILHTPFSHFHVFLISLEGYVSPGKASGDRRLSSATDCPLSQLCRRKAASMPASAFVHPAFRKQRSRSPISTNSGTRRKQYSRDPLSPQAAAAENLTAPLCMHDDRSATVAPSDDPERARKRGRAAVDDFEMCILEIVGMGSQEMRNSGIMMVLILRCSFSSD